MQELIEWYTGLEGVYFDIELKYWVIICALLVVLFIGFIIWNSFIRRRCPKCRATKYTLVERIELDRWIGTKKVTEGHGERQKTKHVNVTYVENEYHFNCNICNHSWTETIKEEK